MSSNTPKNNTTMFNNNSSNASKPNTNAKASGSNVKVADSTGDGKAGIIKIIAVVIIMIIIVIVTFWIVNKIRKGSRTKADLIQSKKFIQLDDNSTVPITVNSSKMASPTNGNEVTYNFWINLADNYEKTTQHKIVLYRGVVESTTNSSSSTLEFSGGPQGPIVCLDKDTNKLMFAVATKKSTTKSSLSSIFDSSTNDSFLRTYIDFIPLQRWVNITIMILDNTMRIYLDGDIYSVVSTNEMKNASSINPSEDNLYISYSDPKYQAKGYITNVNYFNYMISQSQARGLYRRGPFPRTWLNMVGISKYGIQSPIYKIK